MGRSESRTGFTPTFPRLTSEGHPVCRAALSTRSRMQRALGCPDPAALPRHTDPPPVNPEPVASSCLYVTPNNITRAASSQWWAEKMTRGTPGDISPTQTVSQIFPLFLHPLCPLLCPSASCPCMPDSSRSGTTGPEQVQSGCHSRWSWGSRRCQWQMVSMLHAEPFPYTIRMQGNRGCRTLRAP